MKNAEQHLKKYKTKVNRAVDYIEKHLDQELNLKEIAKVSGFSEYHFHRIFSSIMKEPLSKFIRRLRLEKAATLLLTHKEQTITEVAYNSGFSGSSQFARLFKEYFNVTPTEWREQKDNQKDKIYEQSSSKDILERERGRGLTIESSYSKENNNFSWKIKKGETEITNIEVKKISKFTIVYVRYVGPYKGDSNLFASLFQKIVGWAAPRRLLNSETKYVSLYHDNPEITDDDKLRVTVGISVPSNTEVSGEVAKMDLEEGDYVEAYFELGPDGYQEAWDIVCAEWMPQSGYQFADGICYESYLNHPEDHPEGKHFVNICIPVKPL